MSRRLPVDILLIAAALAVAAPAVHAVPPTSQPDGEFCLCQYDSAGSSPCRGKEAFIEGPTSKEACEAACTGGATGYVSPFWTDGKPKTVGSHTYETLGNYCHEFQPGACAVGDFCPYMVDGSSCKPLWSDCKAPEKKECFCRFKQGDSDSMGRSCEGRFWRNEQSPLLEESECRELCAFYVGIAEPELEEGVDYRFLPIEEAKKMCDIGERIKGGCSAGIGTYLTSLGFCPGGPPAVKAEPVQGGGTAYSIFDPTGGGSIPRVIGRIISQILGIVGGLALLSFVYGGFTWMTSAGNLDKVKRGKSVIVWSVIGLVAIFTAYAVLNLILNALAS